MIDLHCHIDLYPKPASIVAEARRRGTFILAVTTTPKSYEGNLRFVGDVRRIRVAVGLHPELVKHRYQEIGLLVETMKRTRYVGEVGLDGSPEHRASLPLQKEILAKVFEACREQGNKVISLHSRMATSDVLDAIEAAGDIGRPILHWFSGTEIELARAINLGCWFSVGPAMLASQKGRLLTSRLPKNRLYLETDGPFGKLNDQVLMPWDAVLAVPIIAKSWSESEEQVAAQIADNFRSLGA